MVWQKNLHGNEFLVFHTDCDMYVHLCYTNCKTKNNEKYFLKIVYSNVQFRFTLFVRNFCETDFTNRSFLCKLNDFTRFLLLLSFLRYKVISRMFSNAQCGKTRNSLPRKFFFVKSIYSKRTLHYQINVAPRVFILGKKSFLHAAIWYSMLINFWSWTF